MALSTKIQIKSIIFIFAVKPITCPNEYMCPGSNVCLPWMFICDGNNDCRNSEGDERGCDSNSK